MNIGDLKKGRLQPRVNGKGIGWSSGGFKMKGGLIEFDASQIHQVSRPGLHLLEPRFLPSYSPDFNQNDRLVESLCLFLRLLLGLLWLGTPASSKSPRAS